MSKVSEYLEPHIYFPNEFLPPEEQGEGDCQHEDITEYYLTEEGSVFTTICDDCGEDLTDLVKQTIKKQKEEK